MPKPLRDLPWLALGGAGLALIAVILAGLRFQRERSPAAAVHIGPAPAGIKMAAGSASIASDSDADLRKASKLRERVAATSAPASGASSSFSSSSPPPPRPPAAFLEERAGAQREATALPLVHLISQQDLEAVVGPVEPSLLEGLRRAFDKDAGVGTLSPDSPEYAKRWAMARPSAADRFRTVFGWAAYAELQRQQEFQKLPSP